MNPFNPMSSKRKGMTERADLMHEADSSPSMLAELVEKRRSEPEVEGFKMPEIGSQFAEKPVSMLEETPKKQYSLGADVDLKKALSEEDSGMSAETGSELIKAGGKTLGTVAEQAAASEQLKSKVGQEAAIQLGRARREAMSRGGRSTQRSLAELMASFRASTK